MLRIPRYGLKRYQALKAQEEKLKMANEGMARAQCKARVEALAFRVSLRKEPMCLRLGETIEQKTKKMMS